MPCECAALASNAGARAVTEELLDDRTYDNALEGYVLRDEDNMPLPDMAEFERDCAKCMPLARTVLHHLAAAR